MQEEEENNISSQRVAAARNDREFEMEEEASGAPRRRRIRKIIVDEDDEEQEQEQEQEEIIQEIMKAPASPTTNEKVNKNTMEEELPKDKDKEKENNQKRNRRLILDDEDEGENLFGEEPAAVKKEIPQEEEKTQEINSSSILENSEILPHENSNRSEITLTRTLSRDILGRRNRQLATNLANREVINSQRAVRARNRAAQIEQQEQEAENAAEEVLCTRCGQENARVLCKYDCGRAYHTACSKRHGRESDRGAFSCFSCINANRKKEKIVGARVNREWVDGDAPDPKKYIPQAGDLVVYVFQAHEDFVLEYFDYLRFSRGEVFPFDENDLSLCHENVCKITDIRYQFPLAPKWYKQKLNVLMKITLEVVEPEEKKGHVFVLSYFDCNLSDFLIPKDIYQKGMNNSKHIPKDQQIKLNVAGVIKNGLLSEVTPREEGTFPYSAWKSLQFFDHSAEEGYALRRAKKEQGENLIYASPWDIIQEQTKLKDEEMTQEYIDEIKKGIDEIHDSNTDHYDIFVEEVNKALYKDYYSRVAYEMNIDKIKLRLTNFYYRHKEGIISDIHLIKLNCHRYNNPTWEISKWATELTDKMTQLIDADFERKPRPPKVEYKPRQIKKKPSPLEEDGHESATNRSPQPETYVTRSRAKRLQVAEPEEEEEEEDTGYKSKLRRPARGVHSYSEEQETAQANQGDGARTRLRRRALNLDEDFEEEEEQNPGLLRSKQRRKDREARNRYNRDLSDYSEEEEDFESEESESEASIASYSQTKRRTGGAGNTNRSRAKPRATRGKGQYFEGDEDEMSPENVEVAPKSRLKTEKNSQPKVAPNPVVENPATRTRTRRQQQQPVATAAPPQNAIPKTQPSASFPQRQTRGSHNLTTFPQQDKNQTPYTTNISINIPASDYANKNFQPNYSTTSSNYPSSAYPSNYHPQPGPGGNYHMNYSNGGPNPAQYNKMPPQNQYQTKSHMMETPNMQPQNYYPPSNNYYKPNIEKANLPPTNYAPHFTANYPSQSQFKTTKPIIEKDTSNPRFMSYQPAAAMPDNTSRYTRPINDHTEFGNFAFPSYEPSYPSYTTAPAYGQQQFNEEPRNENKQVLPSSFKMPDWVPPDSDPFKNILYKDQEKQDENSWNISSDSQSKY